MSTLVMARCKVKAEKVEELEAGMKQLVAALEQAQREDMRYAWFRLPDGVTYVILTEFGESVVQANIPGYAEFDEIVKASIAEKPTVEKLTVSGSYRFF
jgi:quinol monooxygenase YgiN